MDKKNADKKDKAQDTQSKKLQEDQHTEGANQNSSPAAAGSTQTDKEKSQAQLQPDKDPVKEIEVPKGYEIILSGSNWDVVITDQNTGDFHEQMRQLMQIRKQLEAYLLDLEDDKHKELSLIHI